MHTKQKRSERNKSILLSIGIIFKNEIRSLERCLKALAPIREAVPCEVVMADAGSTDGSREIAAKYADILIDFPWINDFAAARNAVMDQCTGVWYLTVDSDEYLDKNISQLVNFLTGPEGKTEQVCAVTIRNYPSYEMDEAIYSDFLATRLVRMDTGARYTGAIHESFNLTAGIHLRGLKDVIFHHDGYAAYADGGGQDKLERNLSLLRKKIKEEPDNLLTLLQLIESGWTAPEYVDWVYHAVDLVKNRVKDWSAFGPPVLRYAINTARDKGLPELTEWVSMAEELFPDSYFVRIDIAVKLTLDAWAKEEYAECIRRGELCLQAYADYRAGRGNIAGQLYSTLSLASPFHEQTVKTMVSNAYLLEGQMKKALTLLESLDFKHLDEGQTRNLAYTIRDIHCKSDLDTAPIVKAAWEGIGEPVPNQNRAERRKATFINAGNILFPSEYRNNEQVQPDYHRHAYTAFLPLSGTCGLGTAAAILETQNPSEIKELLCSIESWDETPIAALSHALDCRVAFPIQEKPLKIEEIDSLCIRLTQERPCLLRTIDYMGNKQTADLRTLTWVRGLVLAAVRTCDWKNEAECYKISRTFAKVEREYIAQYFSSTVCSLELIDLLPAMHRFGWYCNKAFEALDAGKPIEYVF